ncbi:hypothetical protein [Paraburkholderia hospita]|uniref:hypothetical protein n=2 Tax=Paraburkholderia hospita TaxID=169430 RepID=UPI001040D488|nr:hypothetical protein [Paraburkholderia hospita]
MMAIEPLDGVWVDPNYKESKLLKMCIGRPITDRGYVQRKGQIPLLRSGQRSAFSALPTQYATANWIEVVQHLLSRILHEKGPLGYSLRIESPSGCEKTRAATLRCAEHYLSLQCVAGFKARADGKIERSSQQEVPRTTSHRRILCLPLTDHAKRTVALYLANSLATRYLSPHASPYQSGWLRRRQSRRTSAGATQLGRQRA